MSVCLCLWLYKTLEGCISKGSDLQDLDIQSHTLDILCISLRQGFTPHFLYYLSCSLCPRPKKLVWKRHEKSSTILAARNYRHLWGALTERYQEFLNDFLKIFQSHLIIDTASWKIVLKEGFSNYATVISCLNFLRETNWWNRWRKGRHWNKEKIS